MCSSARCDLQVLQQGKSKDDAILAAPDYSQLKINIIKDEYFFFGILASIVVIQIKVFA